MNEKEKATEIFNRFLDILQKNFPRKNDSEYNFLAQCQSIEAVQLIIESKPEDIDFWINVKQILIDL